MTETPQSRIPAGWYPDPRGLPQRRWWDGSSWTHALESPPAPPAAGPAVPAYANMPGPSVRRVPSPNAPMVHHAINAEPSAHEAFPTRRQLRDAAAVLELAPAASTAAAVSLAGAFAAADPFTPAASSAGQVAPAVAAYASTAPSLLPVRAPDAAVAAPATIPDDIEYRPFGMTPRITTGTVEAPTHVNTGSVWLLAVLPTILLGAITALALLAAEFYTPFILGGLIFVSAIGSLALAVGDRRRLVQRDHRSTASPAWTLLTPLAYLVARAVRTRQQAGRGWAPAGVFVVLNLGGAAAVVLIPLDLAAFAASV